MPSFFFALVVTFLAAAGGRDQRLIAHLSSSLGQSKALLALCWAVCAATAALAALAGEGLALLLPPAGKTMLVAFALLLAAGELAWPIVRVEPKEPTRSLGALALVIASRQVGDGPRFLIVAIAAGTGAPWLAGFGGWLGGAAALTLAWAMGRDLLSEFPLQATRRGLAALLLIAAIWTGLSARGIV